MIYSVLLFLIVKIITTDRALCAGNGEACTGDSDCTLANQYCYGLGAFTDNTCPKGYCDCRDTHLWDSAGAKCKTKKTNGQACVDADDKCVTGTCASGTCTCPSATTYNENLADCLTNGAKLLDETCSSTECYGTTGTVACSTTCQCETGYIRENYVCRKPHVGETCIAADANPPGVECASMMSADSSLATETCQSGSCGCPSGSTYVQKAFMGTTHVFCVVDYSGTQKPDGASCDSHNSCQSHLCLTCPGDNAKTCHRESLASKLKESVFLLLVTFAFAVLNILSTI